MTSEKTGRLTRSHRPQVIATFALTANAPEDPLLTSSPRLLKALVLTTASGETISEPLDTVTTND